MRVIAGTLRHRKIEETNLESTRETQDRVREAIFNSLGGYLDGETALDLFCGSGAMAIEAYSRGIKKVYLNDLNPLACDCAKRNLKNLDIKNYYLSNADYRKFLALNKVEFDYIFVDPPYAMDDTLEILEVLASSKALKNGTIITFEMDIKTEARELVNIKILKEKKYGRKKVIFYEVTYD